MQNGYNLCRKSSNEESSFLTINLSEKIGTDKPLADKFLADRMSLNDQGSFVELQFKGAQAAKPGTFIDSPSPWFKKAAIFQLDANSAAVRIFTDEATAIKQIAKIELLDNRVVFSLNHKNLAALLKGPMKMTPGGSLQEAVSDKIPSTQLTATQLTATQVLDGNKYNANGTLNTQTQTDGNRVTGARTDADSMLKGTEENILPEGIGLTPKSDLEARQKVEALAAGSSVTQPQKDFASQMKNASLMIAVLFLVGLGAFYLKGHFSNRRINHQGEEILKMKRLSTMALNAKQQLSLIEVGGEKLLLAVSNDQVSLITQFGKNDDRIRISESRREIESGSETRKALPPINSKIITPVGNLKKTIFDKTLEDDAIEKKVATKGGKINLQVDDSGVKRNPEETIKDVTSIIRQKMKDLPKF